MNLGKARLWGETTLPWPAAGVKDWKNEEQARQVEVTDELFTAIYAEADRILRDSMDIATATAMRITDVRTIRLPADGKLRFKSSKKANGRVCGCRVPVLTCWCSASGP